MFKILHLSDIHLGSGFSHGYLNPKTGLNTRLEDFVLALTRCIDRAIEDAVDLVLFGGDAFPDATPPPYIQELFATQFRRLVDARIPTVLLVGNHDQHRQGQGGASLCIYRTLGVPGFVVGDRLETHSIVTSKGMIQVVTLPWLTHSTLVTRPEMEGLSFSEVGHQLLDRLRIALEAEIRLLDPNLPHILLGHAMLDTAQYGAERFLAVGKGFSLPLSFVARPCFDYVALGHVHRHQILCSHPPVVYAGSIERVDFSEELEEKGFVLIDLDRGQADVQFIPLPARPFKTLRVDLSQSESPQGDLLKTIAMSSISNAIVRLLYKIQPSQLSLLDDRLLHEALKSAHSYSIQAELVSQLASPRLPELAEGQHLSPLEALETYLDRRDDLKSLRADLLSAAQALLDDRTVPKPPQTIAPSAGESSATYTIPASGTEQQLRLL